jgi:hypothetical protein
MKLSKQYNVKWIGSFINVLYLTAPIIGIGTSALNAATFFAVVQFYIHQFASWVTFPMFFAALIICVLLLLLIFYKFIYPSYYTFLNKQTYIHNNPAMEKLEELEANQLKIMKHLGLNDKE